MTDYERIKREYDLSLLQKDRLMSQIYPVGSIYMSINEVSPAALFGGVWERIQDAFLLAASKDHPVGETGGAATVTLAIDEMPKHSHGARRLVNTIGAGDYIGVAAGGAFGLYTGYTNSGGSNYVYTVENGGGEAHNNMPPYLSVYMWVRIK